ncbi:MAG: ATP-binding protein [Lachnospiraceae bacterium]|nr:ATP-binding protein [Lachnospiraceae bacterium]
MERKRMKRISTQIMIIMLLVIAVGVSFAIYAQKIARMHIESDTKNSAEITLRDADAFSIYFSSKIDLTKSIGQSLNHTSMDEWESALQQASEIDGNSFFVIDASGNDILHNENIGISQKNLEDGLTSNDNGLIGPGYDPITGKQSTFAYSAFQGVQGQPLYVLTSLDNETIYDAMNLSVYNGNGYSYIVDSDGFTVLFSRQPDSNKTFSSILELLSERKTSYMHNKSSISELENALKKNISGVGYYRHDGKDCVVSVAPIRISGNWSVITVVNEKYLYSEIQQMLVHTLKVLVIIIVCFIMSGIMILKNSRRSQKYQLLSEQLQVAKMEADRANSAKSEFLSRMSHDIRTPMNTIINLTSLVKEEIDDKDAALCDLEKVETSNVFLLALINDILEMSRIEQGKLELHPENYSYQEFSNYLSSTFEPLCESKNIRFILKDHAEDIDVYVDKVRLNQVCFNLLSNAVKYTPAGGTVSFEVKHDEIQNGKMPCTFLVSDTGIGMSEEFQAHMFEPFEREMNSMGAVQGSGLGLSIVKQIVALMGGTMTVESTQGKGTSVCVRMDLELVTENQHMEQTSQIDLDILQGCHVLVAEDHPLNQQITQRLLNKVGISVTLANNGQEAVECFQQHGKDFAAILMDMRMPVMDGLRATRVIRNLPETWAQTIPIIAITANAFKEDKEEATAAGMNAHLAKPIDPPVLYQTLAIQIKGNL